MKKIATILLNYNGWQDTIACIESLDKSEGDFSNSIIVVDNKSTDDSLVKLEEYIPSNIKNSIIIDKDKFDEAVTNYKVVMIRNDINAGFSGGCNVGISFALEKKYDYVWLLNNDTVVKKDTLQAMLSRSTACADSAFVGSVLYYFSEPEKVQAWGGGIVLPLKGSTKHCYTPGKIDYLTGASILMNTNIIKRIGLMDDTFFMYWEDVEYSFRAKKFGYRIEVAEDSAVYHKVSASVSRGNGKDMSFVFNHTIRGSIIFFKRYYSCIWLIATLSRLAQLCRDRLLMDKNKNIFSLIKVYIVSAFTLK